jgi:hypothetical protein
VPDATEKSGIKYAKEEGTVAKRETAEKRCKVHTDREQISKAPWHQGERYGVQVLGQAKKRRSFHDLE